MSFENIKILSFYIKTWDKTGKLILFQLEWLSTYQISPWEKDFDILLIQNTTITRERKKSFSVYPVSG